MKAQGKNLTVEIWKLSHDPPHESWVKQVFDRHLIDWLATNPNILLFPQEAGGAAPVGAYLVKLDDDNFRALSGKRLRREFDLLYLSEEKGAGHD